MRKTCLRLFVWMVLPAVSLALLGATAWLLFRDRLPTIVLPVRLAITTPVWWEVPVAVVLLVAAIWITRRAGGRLFAAGVQMYGKEPSWREMWRALRTG